jgi:hypothetical protein
MTLKTTEARAYFSPSQRSHYERAILLAGDCGVEGVLETVLEVEQQIRDGSIINVRTAQNWCDGVLKAADVIFPNN